MFKKLLIDKINKNHFFLISLFALLFIGTPGLNKSIYIFHITLILLFIKFELSITRLIISISASIFLIIFVKELNNIDIAFIISLILFSFNFDEQKVKLKNNLTFNLLFFVCFILIIGKLMSPNAKNYLVTWEIAN